MEVIMLLLTGLLAFPVFRAQAQEILWIRQFGSSGFDSASGVAADGVGNAYVAGGTEGTLPGQIHLGFNDAFIAKLGNAIRAGFNSNG